MAGFMDRILNAYNVLVGKPFSNDYITAVSSQAWNYDTTFLTTSEAILAPIKNRVSIDAAALPIKHVKTDRNGNFEDYVSSELNDRLTIMANIDQTGRTFIQDAVSTMLEHGVVALVPVEVSNNPKSYSSYDIIQLRAGTVTEWKTKTVVVNIYNEIRGQREDIELPKGFVAICYNPLYSVMNKMNSTLKRLINKLALADNKDSDIHSSKIDLLVQLPYAIKNETRKEEAERRLRLLEDQLKNSKYGIAYFDATEKITPLNRPVENTLHTVVSDLTEQLHAQLGLTPAVFAGSAPEEEMIMYYNRTIEPIVASLTGPMKTSFFTRTAIRQGHNLMAFQNLFKMAPILSVAEAVDKFTRNEVLSPNEVRSSLGYPSSKDPESDKLRNRNLNKDKNEVTEPKVDTEET